MYSLPIEPMRRSAWRSIGKLSSQSLANIQTPSLSGACQRFSAGGERRDREYPAGTVASTNWRATKFQDSSACSQPKSWQHLTCMRMVITPIRRIGRGSTSCWGTIAAMPGRRVSSQKSISLSGKASAIGRITCKASDGDASAWRIRMSTISTSRFRSANAFSAVATLNDSGTYSGSMARCPPNGYPKMNLDNSSIMPSMIHRLTISQSTRGGCSRVTVKIPGDRYEEALEQIVAEYDRFFHERR